MFLSSLTRGQKACIIGLDDQHAHSTHFLRRLTQLGFHAGVQVEVLHEGFPHRDPIAVQVGSHRVALRRQEATAIEVELI